METMCKSQSHLSFLILNLLFIFRFSLRVSAIRKDIGFEEKRICRNTVQGRFLLTDDNGYVCDALSVDPVSRCCPELGDKFSCQGCNLLSQCCNSYEYCVSCCLNPSKTLKRHVIKVKIAKPATAGTYASVFDFCTGRCRHNSDSVVHENAYLSDFHHCFSLPSKSPGDKGLSRKTASDHIAHSKIQGSRGAELAEQYSKKFPCTGSDLLILPHLILLYILSAECYKHTHISHKNFGVV